MPCAMLEMWDKQCQKDSENLAWIVSNTRASRTNSNKTPLATDNLLENTDGGTPSVFFRQCSLGAAACIPSIYADARCNDARHFTGLPEM